MRDILFRGKTSDGEWVYGYVGTAFTMDKNRKVKLRHFTALDCLGCSSQVIVLDETIGLYTGLKDKNGVRIFEGDILRGFEYPFCSNNNGEFNYFAEIVWFDDSSAFGIYTFKNPKSNVRGISEGNTDYLEYFNADKWEVIGNIHDNPELLEG